MKLTVLLSRPSAGSNAGYLQAHCIHEHAKRGRNLLAGCHITGVPHAKVVVKRELARLTPDVEVEFEGPEGET